MKELAVRLKKGADLKASIEEICLKNEVSCAVILSGVGCLYKAQIARALGIGESRCERMLEKEGIRCRTRWDWPEEKISKMIELREAGYPIS